jgi:hypothetical protein
MTDLEKDIRDHNQEIRNNLCSPFGADFERRRTERRTDFCAPSFLFVRGGFEFCRRVSSKSMTTELQREIRVS